MWRRASGRRRELLHGLIQVAVGYEHLKRGNLYGTASLLRQGARRLARHARRPGVKALRDRALADADKAAGEPVLTLRRCRPPEVVLVLEGFDAACPPDGIRIVIPRGRNSLGG